MMYGDTDESFVDSIYTNLEETDRVLAIELFKSTFSRDLILPEEHAYSVTSIADDFITKSVAASKAAAA